jgi:flavin reductase (DIM6/NTAB) family NADH-FMN oxidoreductase RutF
MDYGEIATLFAELDRELWLITAAADNRRGGLIASFVSQASIVPELPRVVVGVAQQHYTWQLIEQSGAFAMHLLAEDHLPWVWRFGLRSGRDGDKLEGLSSHTGKTRSPILREALAWLEGRVEERFHTGDRTLFLAEIVDGKKRGQAPPLTFRRLMQLVPADRLHEMKEQMAHDRACDALAIRAWRQRKRL